MDWLKQFSDLGVSTGGVESKELKQDQPVVDGGIADRFETNDAETGEWLKNLMDGQPGVAGPGDEALNVETQFPDGNPHAITPPIETYPSVESDAFDIKEISPQRVDQASLIINDQVDINPDESAGLPDWLSGLGQSAAVEGYVGGAVTVDSKSSTGVDIPYWLHAFQSDQTPPDNEGGFPFPEISTTENNDLPPGNDGVNNPVKPGKTVDIPAESPGGELPDWLTGLIQPVDLDKQPQENEEVQAFSDPASQFAKPGGVILPEVDENTTRNKGLVSLAMETFFYDGMELPYWLADFYQQSGAQGPADSDIQPPENEDAKSPDAGLQGSADSETKEKEQ